MNRRILYIIIAALLLVVSCKSTKKTTDAVEASSFKILSRNIESAAFDYKYFSAKAKVDFRDKNMKQGFTATIRMKKDELIWMSLTGPFGIEGARILIEKNRIQIIDRLNRVYYDQPFDFISTYIPFKVDLPMLQNIILANPIQDNLPKQEIELNGSNYLVRSSLNKVDALYYILPDIFKYKRVELIERYPSRNFTMDFDDYRPADGAQFPYVRKLEFTEAANKVEVGLNFQKVKKESNLDFPFEVPDNFKKVD